MAGAQTNVSDGRMDVFIAHADADVAFAEQLAAFLDDSGFRPAYVPSGARATPSELAPLIRGAESVVLVLTNASARAELCLWAADEATKGGKPAGPPPFPGSAPAPGPAPAPQAPAPHQTVKPMPHEGGGGGGVAPPTGTDHADGPTVVDAGGITVDAKDKDSESTFMQRLTHLQQQLTKMYELCSTITKSFHDTQMSSIRNMK